MKLEKDGLYDILRTVSQWIGEEHPPDAYESLLALFDDDEKRLLKHLYYLQKLELLEPCVAQSAGGFYCEGVSAIELTAKGSDFIDAADGFGSEVMAVKVDFHRNVLECLAEHLARAAEVNSFQSFSVVKLLSEEGLKHTCRKILDAAFPQAAQLFPELLQQVKNACF
jgi:hypothetical protein